ncbi:hypothetical protein J7J84_06555, partial [bacterium]|nr:hypothetical protein [bacterium]
PVVTYPASLTVTNSSGTAIHDFNLSISAWWHVEELPVGPNPDCSVYVTIGPDGDVYGLNRNDGTLVLRLINSEWQIEAKLDDGYDSDTWLAFDSQGTISIVGLSSGYPGSSVWFSQYKNDSWTHDYVGTDFWPGYPSLVFDSSDRPVIAYRSLAGGGSMARKTVVATKEGGEWELNVVSEEDEDRITGFFGLDTGPDNRWILGYRVSPTSGGEPPPEVLILRESESGFTRETVMENAWGYDLALTPDGKMVILYGSEGWLRVARETEGDWTFENVAFHVGDVSMAAGPDGTEIVTFTDHGEEGWEDDQAYWAWFHDGEWDIKLLPDPDALGSEAMFHPDGLPVLFTGTKMAMYW